MPLAPAAARAPRRDGHGESRRTDRSRPCTSQLNIDELWRQYKRAPSRACRDQLVEYYMAGHVRRIAERMHATLPRQVDIDDLIQQGYLGLVESIERFDPTRNVKFETFSGRRIFGSMRDYLRSIDPMPRLSRIREKKIQSVTERFRKEFGREPGDDELRKELDLPEPRFRKVMGSDRAPSMVHFNSARTDSDDMDDSDGMRSFEDRHRPTPHVRAEHQDLLKWISSGFGRRDRLIIVLYYYERMTMKEIGRSLGISESRVSQRLDSILQCLRSRLCHMNAAEQEFYFTI